MPTPIAPARFVAYIGSTYSVPSVAFITTNRSPAAATWGQLIVVCQLLTSSPGRSATGGGEGWLGVVSDGPAGAGTGGGDAPRAWPGETMAARVNMRIPDRIPAN